MDAAQQKRRQRQLSAQRTTLRRAELRATLAEARVVELEVALAGRRQFEAAAVDVKRWKAEADGVRIELVQRSLEVLQAQQARRDVGRAARVWLEAHEEALQALAEVRLELEAERSGHEKTL